MTKRVSLGLWPYDDSYRLRVSAPGQNVDSNLSISNLIFDSSWSNRALIYQAGFVSIASSKTYSSLTKIVSWTSLGYIPLTWVGLCYDTSSRWYFSEWLGNYNDTANVCVINTTGIYVKMDNSRNSDVLLRYITFAWRIN